jgi:hypothetical protein
VECFHAIMDLGATMRAKSKCMNPIAYEQSAYSSRRSIISFPSRPANSRRFFSLLGSDSFRNAYTIKIYTQKAAQKNKKNAPCARLLLPACAFV